MPAGMACGMFLLIAENMKVFFIYETLALTSFKLQNPQYPAVERWEIWTKGSICSFIYSFIHLFICCNILPEISVWLTPSQHSGLSP